jgi:hypothetical protein
MESSSTSGSVDASAGHWEKKIEAARQGDREALGEIFQRLAAFLRASAMERLGSSR